MVGKPEGLFINGERIVGPRSFPVYHKYRGHILADVTEAGNVEIDQALDGALHAWATPMSVEDRFEILLRVSQELGRLDHEFARLMAQEAGKPYTDALAEVRRGQQTLYYSAIAAKTLAGQEIPVAGNPGSERRLAFTLRKPYGVMLAITPFNFPLNLVLHKVGPGLAAGNAVIVKPAPATPLTALKVADLFWEAGLPAGWLQVLCGSGPELGHRLVTDPRVSLISFTGSARVGQAIRHAAGLKPVILELGNNSANIVHSDADLEETARILAQKAYAYAGQMCISVQRIYVHRPSYRRFEEQFVAAMKRLVVGDPEDPRTDVGPMIDEAAVDRVESWIQEALSRGAQIIRAGQRQGALLEPWALANVTPGMQVMADEVFAPVAGITAYETFDEALSWTNNSRYGLQTGVFTQSLDLAWKAARTLVVGGVMINDSSAYRADNMPYGGVKESGIGREGPEYAIHDMTYPTVVVFNL